MKHRESHPVVLVVSGIALVVKIVLAALAFSEPQPAMLVHADGRTEVLGR